MTTSGPIVEKSVFGAAQLALLKKRAVRFQKGYLLPAILAAVMIATVVGVEGALRGAIVFGAIVVMRFASAPMRSIDGRFIKVSAAIVAAFFLILIVQRLFIQPDSTLSNAVGYYLKICIGFFMILLAGKTMQDATFCIRTLVLFVIIYGTLNVAMEFTAGISADRTSALGITSKNFTSAALYLCLPSLVYYAIDQEHSDPMLRKLCVIGIILTALVMAVSASKTVFVCGVFILVSFAFKKKKSPVRSLLYISFLLLAVVALVIAIGNAGSFGDVSERIIGWLEGSGDDSARGYLRERALGIFTGLGLDSQLVGIGDFHFEWRNIAFPPHNYFLEILLSFGCFGVIAYFSGQGYIIYLCFKNAAPRARFYLFQLVVLFVLTAAVQPFFSTHFAFGMIVAFAFFGLSSIERNKQAGKQGHGAEMRLG